MKRKTALLTGFLLLGSIGTAWANTPEDSFLDVPKDHWAYAEVQQLAKDGIINGYPDGEFKGDHLLTRYEMSMIVAKAIDKYEAASQEDKDRIDKLSSEYASELNRLGKRVAKVEKRTNSWISGDTRIRFLGNNPHQGGSKMQGGNKFDFRHRITWQGDINKNVSFLGRLNISQKFGEGANTQNKNVRMDLGYVTVKDALGFSKIRVGRSELDSIGHGLIGKAESNDGILLQKKLGNTTYKFYTGAVENDVATSTYSTATKQNSQMLTTAEIGHKFNKDFDASLGYYWANRDRTAQGNGIGNLNIKGNSANSDLVFSSSNGVDLGFCYKMGKVRLFGDYVITHINDLNPAYSRLSSTPKGWAIQLTNGVNAPVFYSSVPLVDRSKVGSDAWMVSYRSVDAGAIPIGGFDTMGVSLASDPYSIYTHATDNVNAIFLGYQKVLAKDIVMSLEYQKFWLKNKGLTNCTGSSLDDTYKLQFQFWY